MRKKKIDLCHVSGEANLFYLTGQRLSAGDLWIGRGDSLLFLDNRYLEMLAGYPAVEESDFLRASEANLVALNGANLSYRKFNAKRELIRGEVIDFDPVILSRLIKNEEEITLMRKAAKLTREGIDFAISKLAEGITEKEIAREFEFFVRERGADSLSFPPIVAFGTSSAFPHCRAGDRAFEKNAPVTIDVGVKMDGYASDLTRSMGRGAEYKKAYDAVERIHDRLAAAIKPGMLVNELHTLAHHLAKGEGFFANLRHGIGHFIGIEVHEGFSFAKAENEILEEGMVLTIEPGLYFPGEFGIRIENTFVVRKDGVEMI
jgi:Xaa-Pro aminopeptidase